MHICFITSEYPKKGYPHGGIGTFVHTISRIFVKKGHKVSVIGINAYEKNDEYKIEDGIDIYRLKPKIIKGFTWYFNNRIISKKIEEIHLQDSIDIVETSELGLAFVNKISAIRYIIRLHGGHHFFAEAENRKVSLWKGFQEKKSFKKADGFIAVSNYVKTHTAKYLNYHNKPVRVIMSPINLNIFKFKPEVKVQPNMILFAGTVCEKKGIYQLIKALPKVHKVFPDIQLQIYGRDWFFDDGKSYISFLKDDISKLDLDKNLIQFMGSVNMSDLASRYAAAELCVFPSLMETQGLVAPEAMAMEKLVIFSDTGPGPETIVHKKTGLLCDPHTVDDISNKIIWALQNKDACKAIAKNAKNHVLSNFNVDEISEKNINFYEEVIDL